MSVVGQLRELEKQGDEYISQPARLARLEIEFLLRGFQKIRDMDAATADLEEIGRKSLGIARHALGEE